MLGGLAVLAASLLSLPSQPVHIAGDGALKQFLLDQWMNTGQITSQIEWPEPAPWAREVWETYHYPFERPFTFEGKLVFPPFFLLLTLPFYKALGFAGLFVIPALSMIGIWVALLLILHDRDLRGWPAFVAMSLAVLSPLTYFGAMFWEHAPGVCALMFGLWLVTPRERPGTWRPGFVGRTFAGALLGAAVMLRPELIFAAAFVFAYGFFAKERKIPFLIGGGAAVALWLAINTSVTGHPLGIHAEQPRLVSGPDAWTRWSNFNLELARYCFAYYPAAMATIILGAASCLIHRTRVSARLLVIAPIVASLSLIVFLVPYSGWYLGFRRWELNVIPLSSLLAADVTKRWRWAGLIILALIAVQSPQFVDLGRTHKWAQNERIVAAYRKVIDRKPQAVISFSQDAPAELSSLLREVPLVWAPPPHDFARLVGEMDTRVGIENCIAVLLRTGSEETFALQTPDGRRIQFDWIAGDVNFFSVYEMQRLQ